MSEIALQFVAEPTDRLLARFKEALTPVYDAEEIVQRKVLRPGQQRKHVFDFEDGVRVIASHEIHSGRTVLHMSVSLAANSYVRVDNFLNVALAKCGMLQARPCATIHRELTPTVLHLIYGEYTAAPAAG